MQKVLGGGNVIPLDRSGSLEQPLFKLFQEKLGNGSWCHIFAEGKVRQNWRFNVENEPVLGDFKFGVGKLIAHCEVSPIVIPIYHRGMDGVIPEKVLNDKKSKRASTPISVVPRRGNEISLYVGEPLDFTEKIKEFKALHPGEIELIMLSIVLIFLTNTYDILYTILCTLILYLGNMLNNTLYSFLNISPSTLSFHLLYTSIIC